MSVAEHLSWEGDSSTTSGATICNKARNPSDGKTNSNQSMEKILVRLMRQG